MANVGDKFGFDLEDVIPKKKKIIYYFLMLYIIII